MSNNIPFPIVLGGILIGLSIIVSIIRMISNSNARSNIVENASKISKKRDVYIEEKKYDQLITFQIGVLSPIVETFVANQGLDVYNFIEKGFKEKKDEIVSCLSDINKYASLSTLQFDKEAFKKNSSLFIDSMYSGIGNTKDLVETSIVLKSIFDEINAYISKQVKELSTYIDDIMKMVATGATVGQIAEKYEKEHMISQAATSKFIAILNKKAKEFKANQQA